MTALWTVGYEKSSFAGFVATLTQAGVACVIDVRDLPLSRRPGFSKRSLAAGLAASGIGYVHMRALGTPPEGREANRRKRWPEFWRIVDERLASDEAGQALVQAATLAASKPSCLLCYEADPCICHRLRVGQMLTDRNGFEVRHLTVAA